MKNSTKNFRRYTYFHTHPLNSQIRQWFWQEISENMCMLYEWLWDKIGITRFFRKFDQTPLASLHFAWFVLHDHISPNECTCQIKMNPGLLNFMLRNSASTKYISQRMKLPGGKAGAHRNSCCEFPWHQTGLRAHYLPSCMVHLFGRIW